jgi:tetratricopeptide (TPR) repeat protein
MLQRLLLNNIAVLTTLIALALVSYYNVIKGPFFFDDEQFIVKNEYVHKMDIQKIYNTSVTQGANINSNFYRPNQQFVFSVIYKVFGPDSRVFHLNSIVFHALNAFLLFLLFILLGLDRNLSFIGAILFLIHPIHTEAVSYISGLSDVLGLFFFLCGLILFIKSMQPNAARKQLLLTVSIVLYLLSLFSKESMVVLFPVTILASLFLFKKEGLTQNKFLQLGLAITGFITVVYLLLKFSFFNFSDSIGLTQANNVYTEHLYVRIFTFISILPEYLKMFLFPAELFYGKPYTAYTDLFTLKAFAGLFIIASTCFALFKFKKYPKPALASGWFLISIAPFSGIISLNAMYLEHWIYVAFIGLLLLILFTIQSILRYKITNALLIAFLIISVLFIKRIYSRNEEWANIEKFYLNEIKYNNNVTNYNNLGMYYADKKNYNKALQFYQISVKLYDAFPQPHYNMANIYIELNNIDMAVNEIYLALKIEPNFIQALITLQRIYDYTKQTQKAAAIGELLTRINQGGKIQFGEIDNIMVK